MQLRCASLVLFSTLATAACATPVDRGDAKASDDALQGGAVDEGDPAVGAIWQTGLGEVCTGTLIAPDVVLTAAHCVADVTRLSFMTGTGTAQSEFAHAPPSTLTGHAVVAGAVHPSYVAAGARCPNATIDVGLLRLAAPITDITPLLPSTTLGTRAGQTCNGVGFGLHNEQADTSAGQKRTGTAIVKTTAARSIEVSAGTGIADSGDSGGPLLCGGKLVGVVSCHIDGYYPLHKVEHYARVDVAAAWIESELAAWH